mmetsp:Transcript_9775/g.32716  ORF Transcript_9775/g.32716 Transcript_9775/m.32716 type:complete len:230 (-) Transcript_9775:1168-1857(-)
MTSSQVVHNLPFDREELVHSSNMSLGKIHHMDVVADSGAVGSVVVVSKHSQLLELADCNLGHVRHKIVGNARWVLSDLATRMCSHRIEISQVDDLPFWICIGYITQHLFDEELGSPVGVCALQWEILGNRYLGRVPIHSGRRREDDFLASCCRHGLDQIESSNKIVFIICDWLSHRFAHSFQARTVNYRVNLVFLEHFIQRCLVTNIHIKHFLDRLPSDLSNSLNTLLA